MVNTTVNKLNDQTWEIEFPHGLTEFNKRILEDSANRNDLIKTIAMMTGYEINLKFKLNEKLNGYNLTSFGKIDLEVLTTFVNQSEEIVEIHYTLLNENKKIEDFEFILEYSIDT